MSQFTQTMRTLAGAGIICLLYTLICLAGAATAIPKDDHQRAATLSVKYVSGFIEGDYHTPTCLHAPRAGYMLFGSKAEAERAGRTPCPHCITGD